MATREPVWELPFLKALENCGVASEAARVAGTGVRNAFKRKKANATFAAAWDAAVALHRSEAGRRALRLIADDDGSGQALSAAMTPPSPCPPSADFPSPPKGGEGYAGRRVAGGARVERAGQSRWSRKAEEVFLAELTVTANVRIAAAAAGFSAAAAYKRRLKDRHLAAAWDAAVETGKARVQTYLVEAATRTFDPDELPIGDEREVPKVSISEAINIARLKGPAASPAAGWEQQDYNEDYLKEVRERIVDKLARLRERDEEELGEAGWTEWNVPPRPRGAESATVWLPPGWRIAGPGE